MQPHAVHVIGLTPFDFHLDGRVRDAKLVLEIVCHGAEHLLSLSNALLGDDDVAAAGDDAGTNHPYMEIVDVEHA
jgi:hypothetical protein